MLVKRKWTFFFLTTALSLLLVGCSVSEEEVIDYAEGMFAEKVETEPAEQNTETDNFDLYLPSFATINEEDENNLLIEERNRMYVLFADEYMDMPKDIGGLKEKLNIEDEPLILEMENFDGGDTFLFIKPYDHGEGDDEDSENYEVVIGFNEMKISSILPISDLAEGTEEMFDIVRSAEKSE
ncbi:hypothetical protein [Texcoconibacillus texcoconensis]|uniref:Lipoprotein n=1 Tax=Texcoconibacillus texcoconensis TaxID=1095777 RepID=A0A840QN55_9BACI|nr:hypothetical protein [Texcoconibacillus texcoconensis]MBB5172788.1 hypothetical protein [Texcoconibacillus texcoconensis]